jgi:glycosyltransferase involved in cell wall biosynthesis
VQTTWTQPLIDQSDKIKLEKMSKFLIHVPHSAFAVNGNTVTADRYRRILRNSQHLEVQEAVEADVLICLHAHKSNSFLKQHPTKKIIIVLTGTDVLNWTAEAAESCSLATAIVALRKLTAAEIEHCVATHYSKLRIIYQTRPRMLCGDGISPGILQVITVANLRPIKDPFAVDRALQLITAEQVSHLRFTLVGANSVDDSFDMPDAPHTTYIGAIDMTNTECIIKYCDIIVCPSLSEGFSDVFCQAIAAGKPLLCTNIPATSCVLPFDYPGFFSTDMELAALILKCNDLEFLRALVEATHNARHIICDDWAEKKAWYELMFDVF